MEMTKQRQGEIAYALLKAKAKKDGVRYDLVKREIGQVSKEIGIKTDELMDFMRILSLELHKETFDNPKKDKEHQPGIPGPDNPFFYLNK
jgi:hypothetical protein